MQRFVVTNYRFTDEFWEALMTGTLNATPILLECEQAVQEDDHTENRSIYIISESVNMSSGYFFCTGFSGNEAFRLEEEMGTLYLSIT